MAAQPIIVGIRLNGTQVIPGITKSARVCPGSTFNLQAVNVSTSPPGGIPIYEWRNLDNGTTQNAQSINTTAIGRWVARISYFNNTSGTWSSVQDTLTLTFFTPASFSILNGAGNPITATNFYACSNRDTTVSATAGFTDYKWFKANLSNQIATGPSLTLTTAVLSSSEGVVTFIVTARDPNGCNVSAQKSFRRDNSVGFTLGNDTTVCLGSPVTIQPRSTTTNPLPPAGSSPLFRYSWSTGVLNVGSIIVTTAGNYSLTIQNLGTGCTFIDTKTISTNPIPSIQVSPDTSICFGTSTTVSAVATGVGPFSYSWNPTTGVSNPLSSTTSVTPTIVGMTTYTVTVRDGINCTTSATVDVTQLAAGISPYFTLSAGSDTSICHDASVRLRATTVSTYSTTYSYVWSPSTGLSSTTGSSPMFTPPLTGFNTVNVTATDLRGCQNTASVQINRLSRIVVNPNFIDSVACASNNVQMIVFATGGLTGSTGYQYQWSPIGQTSPSGNTYIVPVGIDETVYTITAMDSIGCMGDTTIRLEGYGPELNVSGAPDTIGFNNQAMVLTAYTSPSFTVNWFDALGGFPLGTGTTLTLTSDAKVYARVYDPVKDCFNSDTVRVTFFAANPLIVFVPNVFSPQATEVDNRKLKVFGFMIKDEDFSFIVYNQWGQVVYQANTFTEANQGWSGDIKGNTQDQSVAVYTYILKGKYYDGSTFDVKGTSTMLH